MLGTKIKLEWDGKNYTTKSTMALLEEVEEAMKCNIFGFSKRLRMFALSGDIEEIPAKEMTQMIYVVLKDAGANITIEEIWNKVANSDTFIELSKIVDAFSPDMSVEETKPKKAKR